MELFTARRSVRAFLDRDVPAELVQQMKEIILLAPTGIVYKKTKIRIVTDRAVIAELAHARQGEQFIADSRLVFVFLKDETEKPGTPLEDISIAVSHLQLFCASQGLGSCWIHLCGTPSAKDMPSTTWVGKVCGLPETLTPHCMLVVGYPAQQVTEKVVDVAGSQRFI